jgi:protein subunit release factor B
VSAVPSREQLERECELSFLRSSGPGGQHRNKTETAVRLVHRPTGLVVVADEHRSQSRNREAAYERLLEKLVARNRKPKRRRATSVPRSADRRRLEQKKARGQRKRERGSSGE